MSLGRCGHVGGGSFVGVKVDLRDGRPGCAHQDVAANDLVLAVGTHLNEIARTQFEPIGKLIWQVEMTLLTDDPLRDGDPSARPLDSDSGRAAQVPSLADGNLDPQDKLVRAGDLDLRLLA